MSELVPAFFVLYVTALLIFMRKMIDWFLNEHMFIAGFCLTFFQFMIIKGFMYQQIIMIVIGVSMTFFFCLASYIKHRSSIRKEKSNDS